MSPWDELGLAPTEEAGLIRKAYATRLKRTRPEDDPAGFTRLRSAYEAALAMAARIAAQAPTAPRPPVRAAVESEKTTRPEPKPQEPAPAEQNPTIRIERVADSDDGTPARQGGPGVPKPTVGVERIADEEGGRQQGQPAAGASKPTIRAVRVANMEGGGDQREAAARGPRPGVRMERVADQESQHQEGRDGPRAPKPTVRIERVAAADDGEAERRPEPVKPASRVVMTPVEQPRPAPAQAAQEFLPPEIRTAIHGVDDALNRRAIDEAVRRLEAACAGHLLPLRVEFGLKDRLAALLLADQTIPTQRLSEIATQLGWYDPKDFVGRRGNSNGDRLCARIDRELSAAAVPKAAAEPQPAIRPAQTGTKPAKAQSNAGLIFALVAVVALVGKILGALAPSGPVIPVPRPAPIVELDAQNKQPGETSRLPPFTPDLPPGWNEASRIGPTAPAPPPNRPGQLVDDGSARAQYALGLAYLRGDKVPQSYAAALSWFQRASDQGHTEARRNLAYMYRNGLGTAKNAAAASSLYGKGAHFGDPVAEVALGEMLIAGEGGPADPQSGFRWTRQAALTGYMPAMTKLGALYADGTGTSRDLAKAAAWRQAAAAAGDSTAMYDFGMMALKGQGMAADPAEAYRWLSLVARQGGTDAPSAEITLMDLKRRLPPETRRKIEDDLAAWRITRAVPPLIDAY